jgi:hypothetical protein
MASETKQNKVAWYLWPFVALWRLLAFVLGFTGRILGVVLGLALIIVGVLLSMTVVGALVGVPLVIFGTLLKLLRTKVRSYSTTQNCPLSLSVNTDTYVMIEATRQGWSERKGGGDTN